MNKQEQTELKKKVKEAITKVPELSPDDLTFYYKVILSKSSAQEKLLYKPLLLAIEKERKARDLVKSIDSKIVPINPKGSLRGNVKGKPKTKPKTKNSNGANADDY